MGCLKLEHIEDNYQSPLYIAYKRKPESRPIPLEIKVLIIVEYADGKVRVESYVLNNPLKYTDPSGENPLIGALIGAITYTASVAFSDGGFSNWNWTDFTVSTVMGAAGGAWASQIGSMSQLMNGAGKIAFQAVAHAGFGAISTAATGGSASTGGIASALSSLVASGVGLATKNWDVGRGAAAVASGGLTGGLSSVVGGGDFWSGARNGLIVAGLNHMTAHSQEELRRKKEKEIWQRIVRKTRSMVQHFKDEDATYFSLSEIFDTEGLRDFHSGSSTGHLGNVIGWEATLYEGEIIIGLNYDTFGDNLTWHQAINQYSSPKFYRRGQEIPDLPAYLTRGGAPHRFSFQYLSTIQENTVVYIQFRSQLLFDTFLEAIGQ